MNKQIYELNNKENDSKSSSAAKTLGSQQAGIVTNLSKKLLASGAVGSVTGGEWSPRSQEAIRSTHLADFDTNASSSLKVNINPDEDAAATAIAKTTNLTATSAVTPSHLNRTTLPPETPSSSLRQRNCAQQ